MHQPYIRKSKSSLHRLYVRQSHCTTHPSKLLYHKRRSRKRCGTAAGMSGACILDRPHRRNACSSRHPSGKLCHLTANCKGRTSTISTCHHCIQSNETGLRSTDTKRTWSAAFRAAASAKGSQSSRTTAGEADLERPPAPPLPIFCRCFVDTAEATAAPPTACRLGALPEAGAAPASVLLRFAGAAVAAAGGGGAGDGGAATAGEGEREWLLCLFRTLLQ